MTGCGLGGISLTNDMSSANAIIAQANSDKYKAFTEGMVACKEDSACKVGVSMGFAGNLGNQQFFKPETTLDLLRGIVPLAQLGLDFYRLKEGGNSSSGGEASPYIKGDGNVVNVFNKNRVSDNSSMSATITPTINQTDQFSWDGSNYGTQPAQDPVIVEPSYPPEAAPAL